MSPGNWVPERGGDDPSFEGREGPTEVQMLSWLHLLGWCTEKTVRDKGTGDGVAVGVGGTRKSATHMQSLAWGI